MQSQQIKSIAVFCLSALLAISFFIWRSDDAPDPSSEEVTSKPVYEDGVKPPWGRWDVKSYEEIVDDNVQRQIDLLNSEPATHTGWWWPSGIYEFPGEHHVAMNEVVERLCNLDRKVYVHVEWYAKVEQPPFPRQYVMFHIPDEARQRPADCSYNDMVVTELTEEKSYSLDSYGESITIELDEYFGRKSTESVWFELYFRMDAQNRLKTLTVAEIRRVRGFLDKFNQEFFAQNFSGRVVVNAWHYLFSFEIGGT